MAKQIRLGVKEKRGPGKGEEAAFFLREPTAAELAAFRLKSLIYTGEREEDLATMARSEFFDTLLQRVENINGDDGKPITPERTTEIPTQWKNHLIFFAFESLKGVNFLKKQGVRYEA